MNRSGETFKAPMGGLSLQYLSHVTMIVTGIVQPLATIPSISKLYVTHGRHASGQSLTTWFIFAVASLLWVLYGLLNRKPAIYVGNIIGLAMNLLMVNGILMNAGWVLRLYDARSIQRSECWRVS
jgi:uncharacterized protein with PQ loop repeat